jgi:hypothetical protein
MRLFENEFGVGAERGAAIAPQTACVMPGLDLTLIRASINLRNKFFKEDGSPGQAR